MSSKAKRKARMKSSPVEVALARASLAKTVTSARLQALSKDDGDECTALLVDMATIIGTACEAGAHVHGREPWVRRLHGALRAIVDICLGGYRWRYDQAQALQSALELAGEKLFTLPNDALMPAFMSARTFALTIERRQIKGDEIASPESNATPPQGVRQ